MRRIAGTALAALLLALVPAAGALRPADEGAITGRVIFQGPLPKLDGGFIYEPPKVVTQEVVVPATGEARLDVDLSA